MNPFWLDRALGDPATGDGPGTFRSAVELDERDEFPAQAASQLDALGVPRHYVPSALGGELGSFDGLASVLRAVARRDVTLAVGHGKTILGSQPAFLSGDSEMKRDVARRVLAGEPIALALTERGNGSDLLSSVVHAHGVSPRRLHGEKWLINNATRGSAMCVFARTRAEGGPRGFSLLFADKAEMPGAYATLPKIRTHGIRGADISGIRFEEAPCSAAPICGEGAGLAVVLKMFIVTRLLIPNVAVGALDSALRIVLEFARARALYGASVLRIPHARDLLADAIASHLATEAAVLAGARMLNVAPGHATFWSSVLKYHAPARAEHALRDLALVFGARHYLREGDASGMFQKILRDVAILGVFDGNMLVNLSNIAMHASALERGDLAPPDAAFRLFEPSPELDPAKLAIVAARVAGAESLAVRARERLAGRTHDDVLRPMLDRLAAQSASVRREMARATPSAPSAMTSNVVRLASRYADLAAAALAAGVFVHAGDDAVVAGAGDWLVLTLARTLDFDLPLPLADDCRERLLAHAFAAIDAHTPLSILLDRGTSKERHESS